MAEAALHEYMHMVTMFCLVSFVPFLVKNFVPLPSQDTHKLSKGQAGRYTVFDVLRGIAILGVVVIHVCYLYVETFTVSNEMYVDFIDTSMRFALPVFFISSGVLLKPLEKTVKGYLLFLWDRAKKLLPLYILFTALLAYLDGLNVYEFLKNIVTGNASVPYYFLVILMQLYILYPAVEWCARRRLFVYGSFIFSFVMQLFPAMWYLHGIPLAFRFLFFFVWGVHMRDQLLTGRFARNVLEWSLIIAVFFALYAVFPGQYYNMRPFYGVAMFSFLYILFTTPHRITWVEQFLEKVGSMSYWIYLTHFMVMQVIFNTLVYLDRFHDVVVYPLILVVSVAVSVLVGWLVKVVHVSAQKVFWGK